MGQAHPMAPGHMPMHAPPGSMPYGHAPPYPPQQPFDAQQPLHPYVDPTVDTGDGGMEDNAEDQQDAAGTRSAYRPFFADSEQQTHRDACCCCVWTGLLSFCMFRVSTVGIAFTLSYSHIVVSLC